MTEVRLPYGGTPLDRAGTRRRDPDWVSATRSRADALVVPLWRDSCIVSDGGDEPVTARGEVARRLLATAADAVLLGFRDDAPVFAVDLSSLDEPEALELAGGAGTSDVRRLFPALSGSDSATLAYARGIVHWHRRARHCGVCGARTTSREAGHARACTAEDCGTLLFPRIEPAVIVLVEAPTGPARCLLARHRGAPPDRYSTLAGFVEVGESLEDAVRREVQEEAGVAVEQVAYRASQAWPFPAGLMVGFRARARSEELSVDGEELLEARWFSREELRLRAAGAGPPFREDSIGRLLIEQWLAEPG